MVLSDLVRKNVAEFSDTSSHFQYATLENFKAALNKYSMLNYVFLINTHTFSFSTYFIVELPQNRGRSVSIFFHSPQLLLLGRLFSL